MSVLPQLKLLTRFRRFTLRGIEKVAHEWRLLMMGHNIRKLTRKIAVAAANPALAAETA